MNSSIFENKNLARIFCIDYGKKRCGLAVTDPLKIIANPIGFVEEQKLLGHLENYFSENEVETIVVGKPTRLHGEPSEVEEAILKFIENFHQKFPSINVVRHDERFTSKMASQALFQSGMRKSKRREKGRVDEMAATIMLQEYLNMNK